MENHTGHIRLRNKEGEEQVLVFATTVDGATKASHLKYYSEKGWNAAQPQPEKPKRERKKKNKNGD